MEALSLEEIPGQVGTLVLDSTGNLAKATGELEGASGQHISSIVYSMLQDVSCILSAGEQSEPFRRVVVEMESSQFVITMAAKTIFVVKIKSDKSE